MLLDVLLVLTANRIVMRLEKVENDDVCGHGTDDDDRTAIMVAVAVKKNDDDNGRSYTACRTDGSFCEHAALQPLIADDSLVSGESLMNDGTAIVVFVLMLKVVLGASLDVTSVLKFFGHMSLTSIVFGGLAGLLAVAIIGKCAEERFHNDALIQVITTLCCAYLAFFVAESELSTSGVLATVSAGFAVAYYAWPRFVSLEAMEIVWETVEFVGNTVIFFLAGLLFADTVLDSLGIIHLGDFGYLVLVYIALLVIRSLMLAILWIPLNKVGSPVDPREAIAMIWSGLRGAVSLTLAIIIDEEPLVSREMGARIMFHVGGIAAMTLLINATTAASLLRALGLARSSRADEKKLAVLSKHLAEHTAHAVAAAKEDTTDLRFSGADEAILREMVPELSQEVAAEVPRDAGGETAQAYREAFLNVVRSHYSSAITKGILPRISESARLLLSSVDVAMDSAPEILKDWAFIHEALEAPKNQLARLAGEYSMDETMQKSYCVLSFLEAHRQAREDLPRFFHNDSVEVQDLVAAESTAEALEATRLLQGLPSDLVTLARTEMLARKLLQEQLDEVAELKERGLLTSSDASKLDHGVQARRWQRSSDDCLSNISRHCQFSVPAVECGRTGSKCGANSPIKAQAVLLGCVWCCLQIAAAVEVNRLMQILLS
eukprot:s186_g1.t1